MHCYAGNVNSRKPTSRRRARTYSLPEASEFAWEAKGDTANRFQLCVIKSILSHAETKTDAGHVQQRTPLDLDLIVRVYALAQVIRVFGGSETSDG